MNLKLQIPKKGKMCGGIRLGRIKSLLEFYTPLQAGVDFKIIMDMPRVVVVRHDRHGRSISSDSHRPTFS